MAFTLAAAHTSSGVNHLLHVGHSSRCCLRHACCHVAGFSLHRIFAGASKSPNAPICGTKEKNVDNELTARIRNHPSYDENLHSALIEVIEKEYGPEQLSVMQSDPIVSDSLIRGMLSSMNTSAVVEDNGTASSQERLQRAKELMRKSLDFLNRRARDTYERVELPRAA
jgi:hypothetical protein